jgi:formylglycine-generating enzyme required for sulfatase activity
VGVRPPLRGERTRGSAAESPRSAARHGAGDLTSYAPDEKIGNIDDVAGRTRFGWTYDDGYAYTAPVGSFPAGTTKSGCFDMVGNVAEWLAGEGADSSSASFRGASWADFIKIAERSATAARDARFAYVGLRCVRSE